MTHLVQRIVCVGDASNHLIKTFRVAEDQTFADSEDNELALEDLSMIRVVHPLYLSIDLCAAWAQVLGDYEIISPFPQITRQTYSLEPEEQDAQEITRFKDKPVSGIILVRTLQKLGWQRGILHDHGD